MKDMHTILLVAAVLVAVLIAGFVLTKYKPEQVKKALISLVGGLALVVATVLGVAPELIPLHWLPYVNAAVAVATVLGVYKAKNANYPNRDQLKERVLGDQGGDPGSQRL